MKRRKIIVAVTGASGSLYARLLLGRLGSQPGNKLVTAVIFSDNSKEIWKHELRGDFVLPAGMKLYENNDFNAPFASGSSDWDTMIICPASMGTIGRIAGGISNDLIARAADVMLKERRKLIVVPRETPWNLIHLTNLKNLTEAGAIVCPANPSFYTLPESVNDLAMTVVERVLDLAMIEGDHKRWQHDGK
ncbi:MAG: UbiX family flavin prenyltransferase [Bacteroidales bacterium]|jgi:4-hydroxy-3-polyprenylbenzoate decarboxylase|nr:UbiX family flavin prenyltransferase [Bacteroidales bacterium]